MKQIAISRSRAFRAVILSVLMALALTGIVVPQVALAKMGNAGNCINCHTGTNTGAYVHLAVDGTTVSLTPDASAAINDAGAITVNTGQQFEVDFFHNGVARAGSSNIAIVFEPGSTWATNGGSTPSVATKGTGLANDLTNWNTVWDGTHADQPGWNDGVRAPGGSEPAELAGNLYSINWNNTAWDEGAPDTADDTGTVGNGDLDAVASRMGSDVLLTAPTVAGTYVIYFCGIGDDGTGSRGYAATKLTVTVQSGGGDSTAPVPNNDVGVSVESGTYVPAAFDVTATFVDAESAVTSCEYTLNNGGAWNAGVVSGAGPYTCTANVTGQTNGATLDISMRATSSGGLSAASTYYPTRTVDAVAPTTTDNVPAGWQTTDTTVTLTPADAGSGVASTNYCVDQSNSCAPGTPYAAPFSVTTEGNNFVRYSSTDNLGNAQTVVSQTLDIDKTAPTDGSLTPTQGNTQLILNWTAASDATSGLTSPAYKLVMATGTTTPPTDCTGAAIYTGDALTHTETGLTNGVDYAFRVCAYDVAGLVSTGATATEQPAAVASPPTLTTPTVSVITATTATLGATVTADGGAALTARGTVWDTTTAPTANALAEGGTGVTAYTHGRTGLTAGTRIFYRGYATNSAGTSYSPEGSFYTEPATQASTVAFNTVNSNDMNITWTRGSGDEVIVLVKQGAAVDANPADGTYSAYTANAAFTSGTQIGAGNYVVYKGTGTNVTVTGLTASTTYHVAVYEMAGAADDAAPDFGTNYKLTPATGSQATAGANTPPNAPGDHTQYKADGTTIIPQGKMTNETTVVIKATVSDPDADTVSLEIEFQANASAYTDTPNCSSVFVASGTEATATCDVSGFGDPSSLKWQARTNDGSAQSAWTAYLAADPDVLVDTRMDFGVDTSSNTTPNVPANLEQTLLDGVTPIALGGYTTEASVIFEADLSDPDGADTVKLQIDTNSDGTFDCESAYVAQQVDFELTCAIVDGNVNWQARTVDSKGANSVWTPFNAANPDFIKDASAPADGTLSISPVDGQLDLSWTAASDPHSGLSSPIYTVRRVTGTTPPADCATGTLVYSGDLLVYSDSPLTNGTDYAYRVCATNNAGLTSTGATNTAQPAAGCTRVDPTVTILTAGKDITVDGGTAEYNVQVTNNDTGACGNTTFNLSAGDTNGTNFYASSLLDAALTLAPGASSTTSLRVTAQPNQPNSSTNDTDVTSAATGNHAAVTSVAVTTTIIVAGGGCIAAGDYLNTNGDQFLTERR